MQIFCSKYFPGHQKKLTVQKCHSTFTTDSESVGYNFFHGQNTRWAILRDFLKGPLQKPKNWPMRCTKNTKKIIPSSFRIRDTLIFLCLFAIICIKFYILNRQKSIACFMCIQKIHKQTDKVYKERNRK